MLEYTHPNMVQEYFVSRVREMSSLRADARARVTTRAAVRRLQAEVLRKLRSCFGRFPARTPLNARVTGGFRRKDYTVENVIYESRPGFPVTANLYLPRGAQTGPLPCVLAACGHSNNGKAEPRYQIFSQQLARLGFVVLLYDPVSQGERIQYLRREAGIKPNGCCEEHNMIGNPMRLLDDFFGMGYLWDGIRSLDYLLARPETDPLRVGVTGNSGGGTQTTYLTAFDDRFTMAAPSCFVTTYLANLENELPADCEQYPPGVIKAALEIADFFVPHMPRPTLLMGQQNDYFDVRGTAEAFHELRRMYSILGAESDIEMFIGPDGHGYHQANREAMYAFFCKHAGLDGGMSEPTTPRIEDEKTLCATDSGQVGRDGAACVFDSVAKKARAMAQRRKKIGAKQLRMDLSRVLRLPKRKGTAHYRILRPRVLPKGTPYRKYTRLAVETEPGIQALLLWCGGGHCLRLRAWDQHTVYLPHLSTITDLKQGLTPLEHRNGHPVAIYAIDARGIGHSRPRTCNDNRFLTPYGSDYMYAGYGDMIGEPIVGRRVHDVLTCLDLLQVNGCREVHLYGRGLGAVSAAFAGCLHPLVTRVTLINALLSYHELTQIATRSWPLSILPPEILKHLDLPDCYRHLDRKKHLALVDPWDTQMKSWEPRALRQHLRALGLEDCELKPALPKRKT